MLEERQERQGGTYELEFSSQALGRLREVGKGTHFSGREQPSPKHDEKLLQDWDSWGPRRGASEH